MRRDLTAPFFTITARDWCDSIQRARAQRNEIAEQIKLHMSTQIKDGGPAFPVASAEFTADGSFYSAKSKPGMTLRDWFAGQALAGVCVPRPSDSADPCSWTHDALAKGAYQLADAMLAAREAKQ